MNFFSDTVFNIFAYKMLNILDFIVYFIQLL